MRQICRNAADADCRSQGRCVLPSPEKLAKEGKFLEAAKLYEEQALQTKDVYKKRRFLNFAARCYESAGEFSLAVKCFLESGDSDAALSSAVKVKNAKIVSDAVVAAGRKEGATEFFLRCVLRFVEEREFDVARSFCKETLQLGHSSLAEALLSEIDGVMEGKAEKVASGIKIAQSSGEDIELTKEIGFVGNKFLANMPKIQSEVREVPTRCPECGAPLPVHMRHGKVIECEYCGFTVRLD